MRQLRGTMAAVLVLLAGCPAEEHEDDDGAIEGRVASLETQLADLTSRHDQELADLEAGMTSLADELAALDERVDSAETDLADMDARIGELETEVDDLALGVDLTPIEAALENHETRLGTLEGANLASQDWVGAQGFATEAWVGGQGFATEAWVDGQGFATEAWTGGQGFATEAWVGGQGFATEAWVTGLGFAQPGDLSALQSSLDALDTRTTDLEDSVADMVLDLDGVDDLMTYLEIDPVAHTVAVVGANLHIRSGSGTTDDGGSLTGLGNLVIGYNEDDGFETRTGSHNLILGRYHSYTSYAGLVAGQNNVLSGPYSSVTAGTGNEVSGVGTGIGGGSFNQATEAYATVAGGQFNVASGPYASVAGGHSNIAFGSSAAVAGGQYNDANGNGATVAGGWQNEADGAWTAVGGGRLNSVSEYYATVPGNGLYCDENDNVGIGTSTPAYELDVNGDMRADSYY